MSFAAARDAIILRLDTYWQGAHPTVPIAWENRLTVDEEKQATPFGVCEVIFNGGHTASIEADPVERYTGAIYLAICVKANAGTREGYTLLDDLVSQFSNASFAGITTLTPVPQPGKSYNGWHVLSARVPFWFNVMPA